MGYPFDHELAEFVPLLAAVDLSESLARREEVDAMQLAMQGDVDERDVDINEYTIDAAGGTHEVRVRTYTPHMAAEANDKPLAGLLHFHGGGFVLGSIDTEHYLSVALAREVACVVVAVDYRLAPEHPYPAALDDCYLALLWLHANLETLGIDSSRIGAFGQSAGGNLTAALALLVRDRGDPLLCFQCMDVPILDARMATRSCQQFTDTPLVDRSAVLAAWDYYLCEYQWGGDGSAYASPAMVEDLSLLPPAYISVAEFDPLRDEALNYAMRLMHAGVSVELHSYPGTFHGSRTLDHAAVSQRQFKELCDVLKRGLDIY